MDNDEKLSDAALEANYQYYEAIADKHYYLWQESLTKRQENETD